MSDGLHDDSHAAHIRASRVRERLLLLVPLGLSAVVYWPLLGVYFYADDFMCLLNVVNWSFLRFVFQPFAGHMLPVRNLAFWLTYELFGFHSTPFFATVLLTHLVNVWLLFRVIRSFTASAPLASFGAALWGASPLNVGTLGWYSVYGHALVATTVLVVLDRIGRRMPTDTPLSPKAAAGLVALLLLAACCFGSGVGVAVVAPLVVFLLLPATFRDRRVRGALLLLPPAVAVLYFGLRWLYVLAYGPLPIEEAVLMRSTLSRYWPIPVMLGHLVAVAVAELLAGFFSAVVVYPGPTSSVIVAGYSVAVLALLLRADGATRRRVLAFMALCLAVYGIIAVGRANLCLLFKRPFAVCAMEKPYHYVGPVPLVIVLCLILQRVGRLPGLRRVPAPVFLAAALAVGSYGYARSHWLIDQRPQARAYIERAIARITTLAERKFDAGDVAIRNAVPPRYVLGSMLNLYTFPGWAGVYAVAFPSNVLFGHRIRFIEPDPMLVAHFQLPGNYRLADLLVAPVLQSPAPSERPAGRPAG